MERIFTWDELGQVRLEGDDYGCTTAFCRICEEPTEKTITGTRAKQIGFTEFGDPVELLRPVLEHLHSPEHVAMLVEP